MTGPGSYLRPSVTISAAPLSDGSDGSMVFALADLAVTFGRSSVVEMPAPASCSLTIADPDETGAVFLGSVTAGAVVTVTAPGGPDSAGLLIFLGRVSDLALRADLAAGVLSVDVLADDFLADLANYDVGVEPWLAESADIRARHILDAAKLGAVAVQWAPGTPAGPAVVMSWVDVDNQPVQGLLADVAVSVDAIVLAGAPDGPPSSTPTVVFHVPGNRPGLLQLELMPDGIVRITGKTSVGTPVDACSVNLEPLTWRQQAADRFTRAKVTWRDQTTDPEGNWQPTDMITVIDAGTPATPATGPRTISADTLLTNASDAQVMGVALLARTTDQAYAVEGFNVSINPDDAAQLPDLAALATTVLDLRTRTGAPIRVMNTPDWVPGASDHGIGLYVEGGRLTFDGAQWLSELNVSTGGLGRSVTYAQVPTLATWEYADCDPSIRYRDLIGVEGPDL
jgi:hypothetical protein